MDQKLEIHSGNFGLNIESWPNFIRVAVRLPTSGLEFGAEIPTDEAERIGEALVKAARRSPR